MALGVVHQLGGAVEAHGLAVEQGAQEGFGLVPLEPGGGVGEQGEAGGVRFGEAVFAKAFDLPAQGVGKRLRVAALGHAGAQLVLELLHVALAPPRGHGAAQLVGFAGGEAGGHFGQLHHLFLKDWYAQRAFEHGAHGGGRPGHFARGFGGVVAAAEVGMDHVALDGAGPDDGHLHHQVVELARLEARQHAHLCA